MSTHPGRLPIQSVLSAAQQGIAKAEELGKSFTIVVVDDGGNQQAVVRMDGAPLGSLQVANDKAYTAVAFKRPTDKWFDVLENDAVLGRGALAGIDRLVAFGGGLPIAVEGEVVAAVGVSGAHYTDDMQVAEAVAAAFGEQGQ